MKNIFTRVIGAMAGILCAVAFSGCGDELNDSLSEHTGGKAYLSFSVSTAARTITPTDVTENDIAKAELLYKKTGDETAELEELKSWVAETTLAQDETIITKNAISLMTEDESIALGSGTYDFVLNLYVLGQKTDANPDGYGITQVGELSAKEITADAENLLAFATAYTDGTGTLAITLSWTKGAEIVRVQAGLFAVNANGTIGAAQTDLGGETKEIDVDESDNLFGTALYHLDNVPRGSYYLKLFAYQAESTTPCKVLTEIVKIAAGCKTKKKLTIFGADTVFVSGTGDDTTGNGTEINPFETVDKAVEYIIANPNPTADWAIFIVGDVTGPHEGTNKAGSRTYTKDYGRTVIPAELTSEHAKSLLLIGATGLDSDGLPQDLLNRGLNPGNTTQASDTGTVLVIETEVPVTIKNLKITNSNNDQSNGSDEVFNRKGGGLAISSVSTVSLSDGVWITNNKGYYGGGVYNAGTLYIYGSAVIGNRTQEERANQAAANSSEDGGGIYNEGKVYLGYSEYVDEENNVEEEWTGCINYNYSWRGGAINNRGDAVIVFRDGTIAHNDTVHGGGSGGGGGIYNYGSVVMTGGVLEYNYDGGNTGGGGLWNGRNSSYGTGVFTFSGGKIQKNEAGSGNNGVNGGGGVYNNGIMYVYGDALIGDENASGIATGAEDCSNVSAGEGAGIYVASSGELYMGYSDYTSESENTPAQWNKGIYHNYAKTYGGGLGFANGCTILFNSGTIANNGAGKSGGALYVCGGGFVLSGTATIPAGNGEEKQSILVKTNNYSLFIDNSLSHVDDKSMYLLPDTNSDGTSYNTYKPLIQLTDAATNAGLTIDSVKDKFVVGSFTNPITGIVTNWTLDSDGKAVQDTASLYVSATGSDDNDGLTSTTALGSITAAISKINELDDSTKDYVITLDGEITGAQVIEDSVEGKIKANSIKIVGSKSSSLSDTNSAANGIPKDIINANLSDSEIESAFTINTTVPVTLYGIMLTGGHGTEIGSGSAALIAGGGLFVGEGATVSFENYAMVTENTNYIEGSNLSGAGAGVYISGGAKFVMNYKTKVCNNVGTHYGAGIYVADGGYLKTIAGSGSDIYGNTFDERFVQNGKAVTVKGGGIYLADGSTLEQLGTYIRNNPISEGELGSGVYMCAAANYMISGSAQTNPPNDVYMETGAQIEVIASISASPVARLTLESYPVDDGDDVYPVKLAEGLSWTNSSIASCFEITPQTIEGGEEQYWALDKSNSGKLIKKAGMAVSVTVPSGLSNDIEVTVTDSAGTALSADGSSLTGGSVITFTATEGYATYTWKLDAEEQEAQTASHILTLDTADWETGTYVLYLEAKDSDGKYYSYTAQIKVSKGE